MIHYRLQVFRQVAELQNLTKAARALHISQPAVTRHIRLLEENLGVPLFVRSAKGMKLNHAGTVYLQHVQQLEKAHEQIALHLKTSTDHLTGRLRLGSNKTVLAYYLPEVLAAFKSRYPSVICDVIDGNTDTIIGALLDQRIDLALIEGPCRRSEIQMRTILEDEIIWIASPSNPLAKAAQPSMKAVLSQPMILREMGAGSRQFMEEALRQYKIPLAGLKVVQEMPSPEGIKRLVAADIGVSYVFRICVQKELASGELAEVKCPKLSLRRPFSLLYPQGPVPAGVSQAFMEFL